MSFLVELWTFLRVRKKLWLLPIVLMMLVMGGLLVLAQGSALAPFFLRSLALSSTVRRTSNRC